MLPVELILLYMVYLGMGPGACKISRPLDAGFILFQFWVGLISVVPVSNGHMAYGLRQIAC